MSDLYAIGAFDGENGLRAIKIGISRDPVRRLSDLQCASHDDLRILAIAPGEGKRERGLHRRFAKLRKNREWFHPARTILNYLCSSGLWQVTDDMPSAAAPSKRSTGKRDRKRQEMLRKARERRFVDAYRQWLKKRDHTFYQERDAGDDGLALMRLARRRSGEWPTSMNDALAVIPEFEVVQHREWLRRRVAPEAFADAVGLGRSPNCSLVLRSPSMLFDEMDLLLRPRRVRGLVFRWLEVALESDDHSPANIEEHLDWLDNHAEVWLAALVDHPERYATGPRQAWGVMDLQSIGVATDAGVAA